MCSIWMELGVLFVEYQNKWNWYWVWVVRLQLVKSIQDCKTIIPLAKIAFKEISLNNKLDGRRLWSWSAQWQTSSFFFSFLSISVIRRKVKIVNWQYNGMFWENSYFVLCFRERKVTPGQIYTNTYWKEQNLWWHPWKITLLHWRLTLIFICSRFRKWMRKIRCYLWGWKV